MSVDELGNESDPGKFRILIDTTPPTIPEIVVESPTRNRRPVFTYSSTSSDVDVYGVNFLSEVLTSETSFIPQQDLPNGTYTIQVRAKDHFGNWSDSASKSVEVYSIPSGFDVKTLPDAPTSVWNTTHSDGTVLIFLGFSPNDKVGFKIDEFTTNASIFVDCAISGEVFGSIIFNQHEPNLGACVYLDRGGVTYWAKLKTDISGNILDFSDNFTQECE